MGGAQSKQTSVDGAKVRETYYDILEVSQSATQDELKKAYRKIALQLHPDRNHGNVEEATAKFSKVQAAYDVLSDPQERAWYDSQGIKEESGMQYSDNSVTRSDDLRDYIQRYDDVSDEDFFRLVGSLFASLRQEELESALDQDIEPPLLPEFGNDKSNWAKEARPFYDAWTHFASVKTFAWEDIYRAWEAPDRRSRRIMEARNKKIRDTARNEYNDLVRRIVKRVKKRDPRVKQQQLTKTAQVSSKDRSVLDRKANKAKRAQYEEQGWTKLNAEDEAEIWGNSEDSDKNAKDGESESEAEEIYECVVCDKDFKTQKQLISHESSKKHLKAVKALQWEMRKEGIELGLDDTGESKDLPDSSSRDESEIENEKATFTEDSSKTDDVAEKGNLEEVGSDEKVETDEDDQPEEEKSVEQLLAELEGTSIKHSDLKPKKQGKAKQKRSKRNEAASDFASKCSVCQTAFSSRNKLFDHVKKTGHAMAPSVRRG